MGLTKPLESAILIFEILLGVFETNGLSKTIFWFNIRRPYKSQRVKQLNSVLTNKHQRTFLFHLLLLLRRRFLLLYISLVFSLHFYRSLFPRTYTYIFFWFLYSNFVWFNSTESNHDNATINVACKTSEYLLSGFFFVYEPKWSFVWEFRSTTDAVDIEMHLVPAANHPCSLQLIRCRIQPIANVTMPFILIMIMLTAWSSRAPMQYRMLLLQFILALN